jgi:hypothetical protein
MAIRLPSGLYRKGTENDSGIRQRIQQTGEELNKALDQVESDRFRRLQD